LISKPFTKSFRNFQHHKYPTSTPTPVRSTLQKSLTT
jgi:hypothetical protein